MLLFEEKIELTLDQCFKQSLTFTWILGNDLSNFWKKSGETWSWFQFEMWSANTLLQVNLFQKHLFLHQLTHNMTKDCSLIYQFLHENYKLRTCCGHKWVFFGLTFKAIYANNMFSLFSDLVVFMSELVNQWTIFCHIVG